MDLFMSNQNDHRSILHTDCNLFSALKLKLLCAWHLARQCYYCL